jgi:hypothetical protein
VVGVVAAGGLATAIGDAEQGATAEETDLLELGQEPTPAGQLVSREGCPIGGRHRIQEYGYLWTVPQAWLSLASNSIARPWVPCPSSTPSWLVLLVGICGAPDVSAGWVELPTNSAERSRWTGRLRSEIEAGQGGQQALSSNSMVGSSWAGVSRLPHRAHTARPALPSPRPRPPAHAREAPARVGTMRLTLFSLVGEGPTETSGDPDLSRFARGGCPMYTRL